MGVTGLWKLIEASGKPVPLETLENKILAIDISIWLHQVIKGFQDAKGGTLPNAHLLGLFHRLCKLLFYRIRPIFVFDGGIPALKRQTMAKRAQSKNKLLNEADRLQSLLLSTLAKEKVVQQALGGTAVDILAKSPVKPLKPGRAEPDDIFKLPPINEDELLDVAGPSTGDNKTATQLTLHSIDVDSSNFKTLPADVRHEILTDIKETRKQNSWGRLHELPAQADNFSSFQMQRLLKRRRVQLCLEDAEKEMGGQSLSVRDLETLLTEEGIVAAAESNAKRINSDDRTRFLMVSSIKQAMETALQSEEAGTSKPAELGPEFDEDLKRAVHSSLNDGQTGEAEGEIYMSQKQKSNLTEAAKEMARAYMMEYAGMSKEDVQAILGGDGEGEDVNETLMDLIEKNELKAAIAESLQEVKDEDEKLVEALKAKPKEDSIECEVEMETTKEKVLEIVIDPSKLSEAEDDLFADVFAVGGGGEGEKESGVVVVELDPVTVVAEIEDSSEEEDDDNPVFLEETKSDSKSLPNESDSLVLQTTISLESFTDDEIENSIIITDIETPDKTPQKETANKTPITSIEKDLPPPPAIDPKSILESLERQKEEITNITLDDLRVIRQASDSIIEIPDSPEGESDPTPSKKHTLTDYFETSPRKTPKATPEKEEQKETVPYVKSPFFVKRTPRKGNSSEKKREFAATSSQATSEGKKATKFLFASEDEIIPPTNDELIKEASDLLRSQKSSTELEGMAEELRQQNLELEQERNKQSRFGMSITERMSRECQDMLSLFGIPFIVAPMEAEAQCAFLNGAGLTQGTITDDSDVWLFGGACVYKNFFDQKKHVMEFQMDTIEKLFHVDRRKLIQLALLVGSDYTLGILGIGAVTGMEILAQFPCTSAQAEDVTEFQAMMSGLRRFKEWWTQGRSAGTQQAKGVLRNKLKNIAIGEGFPSQAVIEAYLHPTVDDSRAEFSWGTPDVESIREFAKRNFGWTRTRTDELLMPVMKKLEEKAVQRTIKNYFCTKAGTSPGSKLGEREGLKVSKRVQRAVRKLDANERGEDEGEDGVVEKKKKRAAKKKSIGDSDCEIVEQETEEEKKQKKATRKRKTEAQEVAVDQPSTSKRSTRAPRIPETKQIIPQRDRTKQLEDERLKKAAEIFKAKKNNKE